MKHTSKPYFHVRVRFILSVYSIVIFFLPVYRDLSGYSITYFQFQVIFSIPVIFFIITHFMMSSRQLMASTIHRKYTIEINDFLWFLMMIVSILNTYVLHTSQTVYNRFEISYLVNREMFLDITSIKDYVLVSYQVYHAIALVIVLGVYLISLYLSPFIKHTKNF